MDSEHRNRIEREPSLVVWSDEKLVFTDRTSFVSVVIKLGRKIHPIQTKSRKRSFDGVGVLPGCGFSKIEALQGTRIP